MKKLHQAVLVLPIATATLLAGCGSGGSASNTSSGGASNSSSSSNSSSGGSSSSAKADSGQTITYWASQEGASVPAETKTLNQVTSDFEKKTGIHVNFQIITWTDLWNKTLTAVTSGNGPDVIDLGNTWASTLAGTGGFVPLTADKMQALGGKSKFIPAAMGVTGLPGQPPMSVPYMSLAYGLFYNKSLFKQAGISTPPTTWTEFVNDAKKLTKSGVYGFGEDGSDVNDNFHLFWILLRQNGGKVVENGKAALDSSAAVQSTSFLSSLMTKHKVMDPNSAAWTSTDMNSNFANGKIAMMFAQGSTIPQLEADGMKASDIGIAPSPMVPYGKTSVPSADKIGSFVAGIDIGILKSSKHQDADLKFLKYMTSPSVQITLNKAYGSLPPVKAAGSDPAFQSPADKVFLNVLNNYAAPTPLINNEGNMEQSVGTHMKSIWADAAQNKLTPQMIQSELTKANAEVASILSGK